MAAVHRSSFITFCTLLLLTAFPLLAVMKPAAKEAKAFTALPVALSEPGAPATALPDGRVLVFIELTEQSAARAFAHELRTRTRALEVEGNGPASHSRHVLDLADTAARTQLAAVVKQQERFAGELRGKGIAVTEIYRVKRALNGFAVEVEAGALDKIRNLPDVAKVRPIVLKYPSSTPTSDAVPFTGVPAVWQLPAGMGHADGTGMRIGIIDSGIDYIHADFGGSGLLSDYQANKTAVVPDQYFPSAKVVGGTDLAGDAYNGHNVPVPGPDPMDCDAHGTHVAGIAAGFGVTSTGATFTGPYDGTVPFSSLRIHPGVAPKALLYAIRVFGCGGSTSLVTQAIDWALDPNQNGNLSQHLDVVNISIGSTYGIVDDPEVAATDAAVAVGMSVVVAAGNEGNVYFICDSPGSSDRATTVAASDDDGFTAEWFRVNSPVGIAGFYFDIVPVSYGGALSYGGVPPAGGLTGNVVLAHNGANTDACTALTNGAAITGNIAIFDPSGCSSAVTSKNAQNAGAIAAIQIFNTDSLLGVDGNDPTVTIPFIRVRHSDGTLIENNLAAGVNVTLFKGGDEIADLFEASGFQFSSRGPRGGVIGRLKPDITAPGQHITSALSGNVCTGTGTNTGCLVPDPTGFIPGSRAVDFSGTSMATPLVAGVTALLRQLHPTWSPEEIKALLMNGSSHAVTQFPAGNGLALPPPRIGAGRTDPLASALSPAVAFNADDAGTVSITFMDEDFVTPTVRTSHVLVENKGTAAVTYDLSIVSAINAPGISFSLPGGSSLTVPAFGSLTIDVQMSADPFLMQHTIDPTTPRTETVTGTMASLGTLNTQFITEEAGYLIFSISGAEKMRVPLYAAARPASNMSGSSPANGASATGSGTIALSGTGVCTGVLAGSSCSGSFPTDEVSLVSPFELQAVSPRDPVNATASADIQYAGVAYDPVNDIVMFGVSTYGDWGSPSENAVYVYIDGANTVDALGNPIWDHFLLSGTAGALGADFFGDPTGDSNAQINIVLRFSDNFLFWGNGLTPTYPGTYTNGDPGAFDNALMRNNTIVLSASRALLGITGTAFKYKIFIVHGGQVNDRAGPFAWDTANQGLNFGGKKLAPDLPGATLPVSWNTTNLTTDGALGALLLHHHNVRGLRAEVIPLNGASTADLAVGATVSPGSASQEQNVTLTVSVTNNGPAGATGVSLWVPVPIGTIWVSDDGLGAYNHNTTIWSAGSLDNSATAYLHIVLKLISPPPYRILAQLSASSPLDPNVANNLVSFLYGSRSTPTNVTAIASTPTRVDITWGAVLGANSYEVDRASSKAAGYVQIGAPTGNAFSDMNASANAAYLYRVRAVGGASKSASSTPDLATTVIFTDPNLPGVVVQAGHLLQLRTAVNAVRILADLSGAVFTDASPAGVTIKAQHVTELRDALDQALMALGFTGGGYTAGAVANSPVLALHFQEIRDRVK